jgi:medium-chain acyl-[acyl-carrier-protein] hydrolase
LPKIAACCNRFRLVFFGHSLGALLCFETARSLRRENRRQPAHLFVSATEAPHRRSAEEPLSGLPKSALVKKLREFNGAPAEAPQNDELLDLMLPTVRADFELCETYEYHPESPLECPMTIYGGLEDHEVETGRLTAWREMTTGACEMRMFPGGHFYLNGLQATFLQTFAGDLLRLRLQNRPKNFNQNNTLRRNVRCLIKSICIISPRFQKTASKLFLSQTVR